MTLFFNVLGTVQRSPNNFRVIQNKKRTLYYCQIRIVKKNNYFQKLIFNMNMIYLNFFTIKFAEKRRPSNSMKKISSKSVVIYVIFGII